MILKEVQTFTGAAEEHKNANGVGGRGGGVFKMFTFIHLVDVSHKTKIKFTLNFKFQKISPPST